MNHTPTPISQLSTHLVYRSRKSEGRGVFERLEAAGVDSGGSLDLYALACSCHQPGTVKAAQRVVGALLGLVPDELASLALLVALRPGLIRLSRRLVATGSCRDDAEAQVIATAYLCIRELDAQAAGVDTVEAINSAIANRLRVEKRVDERYWQRNEELVEDLDLVGERSDPAEVVTTLLDDAVAKGAITDRQAKMVSASRIDDICPAVLACGEGKTASTWRKERERAEVKLRAFVEGRTRHSSCRLPSRERAGL